MSKLQRALTQKQPPGIYWFDSSASREFLTREVQNTGWRLFYLNGNTIQDKATFLDACAQSFDFPSYCGKNWDAFEECLNDLSWAPAPGYVVLFQTPEKLMESSPDEWSTAAEIFKTASANWNEQGVPFYVLLRGASTSEFPQLGASSPAPMPSRSR